MLFVRQAGVPRKSWKTLPGYWGQTERNVGYKLMTNRRLRARKGQTTSEIGPALLILLIIVFFPMLDLLYLGLAYACGWYENHLAVRECACRLPTMSGTAETMAANQFNGSTLRGFIRATVVNNAPSYTVNGAGANPPFTAAQAAQGITVRVTSLIRVKSFLSIPFFSSIPGMGQDITFQYTAERPQEETGLN